VVHLHGCFVEADRDGHSPGRPGTGLQKRAVGITPAMPRRRICIRSGTVGARCHSVFCRPGAPPTMVHAAQGKKNVVTVLPRTHALSFRRQLKRDRGERGHRPPLGQAGAVEKNHTVRATLGPLLAETAGGTRNSVFFARLGTNFVSRAVRYHTGRGSGLRGQRPLDNSRGGLGHRCL